MKDWPQQRTQNHRNSSVAMFIEHFGSRIFYPECQCGFGFRQMQPFHLLDLNSTIEKTGRFWYHRFKCNDFKNFSVIPCRYWGITTPVGLSHNWKKKKKRFPHALCCQQLRD